MNPTWISKTFFDDLRLRLQAGCHVALIAPRQSAKAVVLFEIKRQAEGFPKHDRPQVVILRATDLSKLRTEEFVAAIAKALGVRLPQNLEDAPLPQKLLELIRSKIESDATRRSLWFFVQNLTELPWPHARALLTVFQEAAEDDDLKRRLSVVVTGSRELVPLTYSDNSPYRHSEKYFLIGLDRDYTEKFFRARLAGASLFHGFQTIPYSRELDIEPDALELLWKETGGYAKFIEEIAVVTKRPGPNPGNDSNRWTVDRIQQLIELFVKEYILKEYDCGLSLREVEQDSLAWERLQQLVDCSPDGIALDGHGPHSLDIAGIVRRDPKNTNRAYVSSPIWERYLHERLVIQRQHRADTYALLGNWDKAWSLYESERSSISERVLDGIERYSLNHVLDAWEQSLIDKIRRGPAEVLTLFSNGARHLLGFSWLKVFQEDSRQVIEEFSTSGAIPDLDFEHNVEDVSETDGGCSLIRRIDRLSLKSSPTANLLNGVVATSISLEAGREQGREIDSTNLNRIRQSFSWFWRAYRAAKRFEYDATIGALRERHLQAIEHINQLLSLDPGDMRSVVEGTAKALVEKAGYYRTEICLVSPLRDKIQAVASCCLDADKDFVFRTEYSLDLSPPEELWDVQKWVAIKGVTVAIRDASDSSQFSPGTQWQKVRLIGMKAIVVVPIKLSRRTQQGTVDEILGTIHFERQDKELPSPEEIKLFEILASQIAVAFDQARRTTLLEQTLHRLDDPIRVLAANEHEVIFRNRAAATIDGSDHVGWQSSAAIADARRQPTTPENVPALRSYVTEGDSIWDELKAPIVDFRAQLELPFQGDGQIGIVQHRHKLTELLVAYKAFQHWLGGRDETDTARRILAFFKYSTSWCRIYRIRKKASGEECLESFAEFGITDAKTRRKFRQGGFSSVGKEPDHQAWFLLDEFLEPAVFQFDPEHHGKPVPSDRVTDAGVPTFVTTDQWRQDFGKQEMEWIEAPLFVGNERVGLIAFPKPQDFSPKMYAQIRWWVGSVAVALWNASQMEERNAIHREKGWKEAAQMVVHQLTNRLLPVESAFEFAKAFLSLVPSQSDNNIQRVISQMEIARRGIESARDILQGFYKYASDKPFSDVREQRVSELITQVEQRLRRLQPEVMQIRMSFTGDDAVIRTSSSAILEVFEVLVSNSVVHSGKTKAELVIEIAAAMNVPSSSRPSELRIVYRDNGRGIPSEYRTSIFKPFFTTHARGSGLGSVIAQRFMRRLGGHIKLDSAPSTSGACFILTIPINA